MGKKQAIRNLSDIYTDNSPVNVKENYTEYIQYWKDENDVESYMRRLYVARAVEWRRTRSYVQRGWGILKGRGGLGGGGGGEAISTILEEEQKEGSDLSRKVNSIIERDYRGKISLKDIGKELFVNSSYLSRVYKKRDRVYSY